MHLVFQILRGKPHQYRLRPFCSFPPRVSVENRSGCNESMEMLSRLRPTAFNGAASFARVMALVVIDKSFSPSICESEDTMSKMSLRMVGSPPVKRICSIPSLTKTLCQVDNFLLGQNVIMWDPLQSFRRHTIDTAEVASVGQ